MCCHVCSLKSTKKGQTYLAWEERLFASRWQQGVLIFIVFLIIGSCSSLLAKLTEYNASSSVGRYCEYQQSTAAAEILDSCGSQAAYTAALVSFCKSGSVGVLEWTPDENTPDTVYYQVGSKAQ